MERGCCKESKDQSHGTPPKRHSLHVRNRKRIPATSPQRSQKNTKIIPTTDFYTFSMRFPGVLKNPPKEEKLLPNQKIPHTRSRTKKL
mmetsp:Transcript_13574/g.20259  ORF Transcript_13574/g.20259 Transcript_13574/m.20259 type:complete len:88 (-) Transcript_13574:143-406(-)